MITMKSNLILDLPVLLACKMPHFCDIHNFEKEIFFHRHYFLHALILKDKNHFKAAIYIKNSLYEFNDSAVNKINDEKEFFHSRNVYGAFYISKKWNIFVYVQFFSFIYKYLWNPSKFFMFLWILPNKLFKLSCANDSSSRRGIT